MKQLLIVLLCILLNPVLSQAKGSSDGYQTLTVKINVEHGDKDSGTFLTIYDKEGFLSSEYSNKKTVSFSVELAFGEPYKIEAFNKYYIIKAIHYTPSFELKKNTINLEVERNPRFDLITCYTSDSPKHNTLYYKEKETTISRESKLKLNRLVSNFYDQKVSTKIIIASHTDSNRSSAFNSKLSKKRAKMVKAYLMDIGVLEHEIILKSYGESRLSNKCSDGVPCSVEEHQQNNRISFRFVSN